MFFQNLAQLSSSEYFSFHEFVFYDNQDLSLPLNSNDKPLSVTNPGQLINVTSLPWNLIFLTTPKYQSCTVLILHFFLLESSSSLLNHVAPKFNRPCHYLYQKHCSTLCDPNLNWHYFVTLNFESLPGPSSQTLIIPRNTYIRNAVMFDSTKNKTSILVRFDWIFLSKSESDHFDKIQLASTKRKRNLEKSPLYIVLPFELPNPYKSRKPWHIFRSESDSHPTMLLHHRIAERVNGTLTFKYLKGSDLFNVISETPNGMSGMYGINKERLLKVDYSSTLGVSKLNFVTGLPKRSGYSFSFLFKPLTFWLWLSVSGSFVLLTISLKLILASKLKTTEVAFAFLLPLLDQSMPHKFWNIVGKHHYLLIPRFLIITWLLSCLLLSNLYRSFITGYLIQPSMTDPPKTFRELALSEYTLAYQDTAQGNVKQGLFLGINGLAKSNQSHRFLSLNVTQCFSSIVDSLTACINFAGMVEVFGRINLVDANGNTLFRTSQDSLFPTVAASPVNPSSDLKEAASVTVRRYLSSGINDKCVEVVQQFNTAIGMQKRKLECQARNQSAERNNLYCNIKPSLEYTTEIVMYPIFVLLIGLSICCVIFMYENATVFLTGRIWFKSY